MLNQQYTHSKKAASYTGLVIAVLVLILFLLKWKLPSFEKEANVGGVDVEVNWPPDPPAPFEDGGGGGGQSGSVPNEAGSTAAITQDPGEQMPAKVNEADQLSNQPELPNTITKNKSPKTLASNTPKTKPKKNIEPPSSPTPKAIMGKTNKGAATGGAGISDFEKTGGTGNGWGTGKGDGAGGGSGEGTGGGNGTGIGVGNGPRVTRGDRRITRSYAFEGELNKATLYVNIVVSPEGVGKFVNFAKGSTATGSAYRQAIVQYLEKIRFDVSDHESMVTVQFNFRIN